MQKKLTDEINFIIKRGRQLRRGEAAAVFLLLAAVLSTLAFAASATEPGQSPGWPQNYDFLITNARIVDGSGSPGYRGDVAIKNGYIAAVGDLTGAVAQETIDGAGKLLTPGFIDLHTHTEEYWAASPDGAPALLQGITTELAGNCGTSVADVGTYLDKLDAQGSAINVGMLTGYKVLRRQVGTQGQATPEQVEEMCRLLQQSISRGSLGFSVGLGYAPQNNAATQELVQLAKAVQSKDALFALHIRNEGDQLIESVEEALTIARQSGVRLQYNHVKAAGQRNWEKLPQALSLLEQAVQQGLDIRSDVYGYTFSSNDHGSQTSMQEENVRLALQNPYVLIASDGGLYQGGRANYPRAYANAARILQTYVKQEQVLSLEQAVAKMTWQPARRLGLADRGLIKTGMRADLNLFALAEIQEAATRTNPMQLSQGMAMVFVNGVPAVREGKLTGAKAGLALRSHPDANGSAY